MTVDLTTYDGPVRTYDGHEAVILDRNMSGDHPILAKVRDKKYEWKSVQVRADGTMKKDNPFLVPVPSAEKELASYDKEGWTNVRRYKNASITCGTLYRTREDALEAATTNTIATVKVSLK